MATKTPPPPPEQDFGEFEDLFFKKEVSGWGDGGAGDPFVEAARKEEEARIAAAAKAAEAARVAEEARKVEEARQAEAARVAAEARKREEARLAEVARVAEEARLAEEARQSAERERLEQERIAEEARRVEAERIAIEARRLEDARLVEERAAAEAKLAAERAEAEARRAEEDELLRFAREAEAAEFERAAAEAAAMAQMRAKEEERRSRGRGPIPLRTANPTLVFEAIELPSSPTVVPEVAIEADPVEPEPPVAKAAVAPSGPGPSVRLDEGAGPAAVAVVASSDPSENEDSAEAVVVAEEAVVAVDEAAVAEAGSDPVELGPSDPTEEAERPSAPPLLLPTDGLPPEAVTTLTDGEAAVEPASYAPAVIRVAPVEATGGSTAVAGVDRAPLAVGAPLTVESAVRALEAGAAEVEPTIGIQRLVEAASLARTRLGVPSRARDLLDEAAKIARSHPDGRLTPAWWTERARTMEALGERQAAMAAWQSLAAPLGGAESADALAEAARLAAEIGNEDATEASLARASARNPEDLGLLLRVLAAQRRSAHLDAAVETLSRIADLEQGPARGAWLVERARLLEGPLGRPQDAAPVWVEAVSLLPGDPAAFAGAEAAFRAAGDPTALAALYESEGERVLAQADAVGRGAEASWWFARAARVQRTQRFDSAAAARLYGRALDASPGAFELRHEHQLALLESGLHSELAASLRAEIALAPEASRSFLEYRLGRVCEVLCKDVDAALVAYRAAAVDPAAAPAAEAVMRIHEARGEWRALVDFLGERLGRLSDPSLAITGLYRAGETCEGPLDDQSGARVWFERILEIAPGYLPALEALERVYTRLGAWAQLAAVYEQRALLAADAAQVALQRHRAGAVYEFRLSDGARAAEQYRLALDVVPDFPASLDAYIRVLEAAGDWAGLGRVLRAAAAATRDGAEAVSLYYRAGRVYSARTEEMDNAVACLRSCLERSPGFLPALILQKELAARRGDTAEWVRLERAHAEVAEDLDRRGWRLLAAAEASTAVPGADPGALAELVRKEDPDHAAARDVLERSAIHSGGALAWYRSAAAAADGAARVRLWLRVAELASESHDSAALHEALVALRGNPGVPSRALARAAAQLGRRDEALGVLVDAGLGDGEEAVRLGASSAGEVARVKAALEMGDDAEAAVRALQLPVEPGTLGRAHLVLAKSAVDAGRRGVHARVAAGLLDGAQRGSLEAWMLAFEANPGSRSAWEGVRRALIQARDREGLQVAASLLPVPDPAGLAEGLEAMGDLAGAAAVYRTQVAGAADPLAWSLRLERVLTASEDWQGVLDTVQARLAHLSGPAHDEAAARCRWLLAEKLQDSEEAWESYQRLHRANPSDVAVLHALVRISTARGDTAAAMGFLDALAKASRSPAESASVLVRLAELQERGGDLEAARASLAKAIDLVPDDPASLRSLRRLSEAAGDWQGVVGVLGRLAASGDSREQIERYAEIARIWEEKLQDPRVAVDAWRKVLALAPDDGEALRRLVTLCESSRDWDGFVEYGQALLRHVEGAERASLMRRLGVALMEHMRREEDAIRFFDGASSGPSADLEAARHLERIWSARGEHAKVVDALLRRARTSADVTDRAEAYTRAARIRIELLRDRPGAAQIYGELLEIAPDSPDAMRFRAEHLWESGDYEGVLTLYARMEPAELQRDTDDFDTQVEVAAFCFRFAEALRRSGRMEEAVARYEQALKLNPTHLPSLEAVGPLYMVQQAWTKADKVWKQLLQLTGGAGSGEQLATIYANLGTVEFRLGQPEKARKRFAKALELRPNDIAALKGLAAMLFDAADWHTLLNIYNNIIFHTFDPADVIDAYLLKGFVLDARLGLPDKAAQHYEKSLGFDPAQPGTLLRMAELALRRQDWPEAASLAERGLQIQVDQPSVRACLLLVRAIAYQACGDGTSSSEGTREATRLDPWLAEQLAGVSREDHEAMHEVLKARLQSAPRL